MAIFTNDVYYYGYSQTFKIPSGVTAVQIECYAGSFDSNLSANRGGSYSKILNFPVTFASDLTVTIGTSGGKTWVSNTGAEPTTATQGCLAYGGAYSITTQKTNIGDVKFPGGEGISYGPYEEAVGGQAGPNGPGGNVGQPFNFTNPYVDSVTYTGGGANGGSVGGNGVFPYGRTGSGGTKGGGSGGYWDGSTRVDSTGTMDVVGTANVVNNRPWYNLSYGPMGGGTYYAECFGGCLYYKIGSHPSFVVITVIAGTRNIFIDTAGPGSLTLPSDFVSLVSVEVLGAGGAGASSTGTTSRYAGGGGGGWAKTYGSSINPGLVAGSTVYYNVGTSPGSGISWINMFSNAIPNATTYGVGASGGTAGSGSVGGSGGTGAYAFDTFASGGAGGTGSPLSRNNAAGGGGAGSPFGAGGAGGNAYTGSTNRGHGGGGYSGAGTISASAGGLSAGGAGGSVTSGAGGAGGTSGNPSGFAGLPYLNNFNFVTGPFTSGAGGGGGGFNQTTGLSSTSNPGGIYDNGIIKIAAGAGGGYGGSLSSYYGAGGGGNSIGSAGGPGWVLITYTAAYIAPTNKSNLLAFF